MRSWKLDEPGGPLVVRDGPSLEARGSGVVYDVLAAHLPAYTNMVVAGPRGLVPTPLTLGVSAVGRVSTIGEDVVDLSPGDLVLDIALLTNGDVTAPEEVLLGWTGIGGRGVSTAVTEALWRAWPDGTFAEQALRPRDVLVRLPGAEAADTARLAVLPWLTIALGAVERSGLQSGDVVVVPGATGQLGGAVVLAALGRGASRVVAAGRNPHSLRRLAALDPRVEVVEITGERTADATAIRSAAGGDADIVIDALGAVPTPAMTMAAYDTVGVDGTVVLVGGVRQDLPIPYGDLMHRRITLRGSWMAPPSTALAAWRMVRSGVVDLTAIGVREVGLDDPPAALDLAARTTGLDFVVLIP